MQASSRKSFELILSRLKEFFARRAPWHRRLWNIGTVLGLREVVEYADACVARQATSTEGLQFVIKATCRQVRRDPSVSHLRSELCDVLERLHVKQLNQISGSSRDELEQLTRRAELDYLRNWQDAPDDNPVEFTARAIAAHLLDAGFSDDHLFRWLNAHSSGMDAIADLAAEATTMVDEMPSADYEVFVACRAPLTKPTKDPGMLRWVEGAGANAWIKCNIPHRISRRHRMGFLVTIPARDPWAAVEAARAVLARADARLRVADHSNRSVQLEGWALVANNKREFRVRPSTRHVEIGSLRREDVIYRFDHRIVQEIDDALELASYMESDSSGSAITGGWSAIEGLLIRPGERKHYLAADRLAALVACSLPRAELTTLAYRHTEASDDALADALSAASSNFERVQLVEAHLRQGQRLALRDQSDIVAENRMINIIRQPSEELDRVLGYMTESLRRLYNQRNTIVHAGSLKSVLLPATLRTAFGIVGAGLDRIVHAQIRANDTLNPLGLVARAETELRLVGTPGGRDLASLLT